MRCGWSHRNIFPQVDCSRWLSRKMKTLGKSMDPTCDHCMRPWECTPPVTVALLFGALVLRRTNGRAPTPGVPKTKRTRSQSGQNSEGPAGNHQLKLSTVRQCSFKTGKFKNDTQRWGEREREREQERLWFRVVRRMLH